MQTQIWLLLKFCTPKLSDLTAPKISYTKVVNKMAYSNSADPDQTAPEGAVWSGFTLFAIPLSILFH